LAPDEAVEEDFRITVGGAGFCGMKWSFIDKKIGKAKTLGR
jgi:hypothetical protein